MGTRRFLHVLSASCLARADPHPTARALGSSPPLKPSLLGGARCIVVGRTPRDRHAYGLIPSLQPRHCLRTAMASSITSLRCELHLLRAAFAAAPPSASAVLSTSVAPPAGSNPSGVPLPYGRVTRAHAPMHVKCPVQTGRTRSDGNGVRVHTSPNSTNPSMSMTSQTTT